MRAVIQRVSEASVTVDGHIVGAIGRGLLILLGVSHTDTATDAILLAAKIAQLRIFSDQEGKFNLSLLDVGGALRTHNIRVATGVFGAMMQVALINDGPVTLVIDSGDLQMPRRARSSS
jgi:D-tyrosyl-tRNA(Tyr) deacylase